MIKSELQIVLHYWCYGQHRADIIIQVLCVGFPHKKKKKKKKGDWSEIWPWAWAVRSLSKALAICQGGYLAGSTKYTSLVRKVSVWSLLLDPHYLGLSHFPRPNCPFTHYITSKYASTNTNTRPPLQKKKKKNTKTLLDRLKRRAPKPLANQLSFN